MTAYDKVHDNWEDLPSTATPINAAALEQIEEGIADAQDTADSAATAASSASSAVTAHLADSTDAHDASAISILDTGAHFVSSDVEGALAELAEDVSDAGYFPGGPDVAVADGGTGASTPANARTNLGLAIGTDVQAYSAVLAGTTASFTTADETKLDAIEALADVTDAANVAAAGAVMDTGDETIAGVKTFTSDPIIPDEAYGSGWNGVLEPPTKNAVYDKIEALVASSAQVKIATAIGDGGGNHSTTSTSFADIHASLYDISIPAVAGDLLVMRLSCQFFGSAAGRQLRIRYTVAGTAVSTMPTNGLFDSAADTNSGFSEFTWRYVVQSGDISGGNVAVVPQFATDAATMTIRNDGTNGKPLMMVENWRQ